MAALTGHGHPGAFLKVAKMALINPCMEFGFFEKKCLYLTCYESAIL